MVEGNGSKVAVAAAQKEEKVQLLGERKRERERSVDEGDAREDKTARGLIHRVSRIIATRLRLESSSLGFGKILRSTFGLSYSNPRFFSTLRLSRRMSLSSLSSGSMFP